MLQNIRACRNEKPLWSSGTSAEHVDLHAVNHAASAD
jgi:hypothetical protein